MSLPQLNVYVNGPDPVTGDQLNTFVQWCPDTDTLRTFVGVEDMTVYLEGIDTPGDGGAGTFWWNPSSTAVDDNANVIVPPAAASGAWNRLAEVVIFSPTPWIPVPQNGNPSNIVLSSLSLQGVAASATQNEYLANIGFTSGIGSGAGPLADKVALYVGMLGEFGTDDIWAINTLTTLSAGSGSYNSFGYEMDVNNLNANRGEALGAAGFADPVSTGLGLSGVTGSYRNTVAINISGPGAAIWNRGIAFTNDSVAQVSIQDFGGAVRHTELFGAYTYGFDTVEAGFTGGTFRMGNGQAFVVRNFADNADIIWMQTDGSDNLELGNASLSPLIIARSPIAAGAAGGPNWTTGSGVPGATQPKGSFYTRTGGGVGSTLYVSQGGGVWNAVAGV